MDFKYDQEADAIYITLSAKSYAYGEDLDDERRIDYAADKTAIGVELLCVSQGVNVANLPHADEIAEILEDGGIRIYMMEQYVKGYSSVTFDVQLASPSAIRRQSHTAQQVEREKVTA